jgi:HEAT repeat protein
VSEGLAATFQVLTKTPNEAGVRALIAVLDSPLEPIRRQALETLIARRSSGGKREVLARIDELDERGLAFFRARASRMTATLRAAILDLDDPLRSNACHAALILSEVDLIPALVSALENQHDLGGTEIARTLIELADCLASQLHDPQAPAGRRDPVAVRDNVLGALERAVRHFSRRDRKELVEAFVLLVPASNITLVQTLNSSGNPATSLLLEQFTENLHPAVMQLVLDLFEDPKAPVAAITAVARRSDLGFVRLLLRKTAGEPAPGVRKNLKRVRSLAWLQRDAWLIDQLSDDEQHAALTLGLLTKTPRDQLFVLIRYLLEGGGTRARRMAAKALGEFNGKEANELALRTLDDPDPFVQAAVLTHLRQRGIPGVMPKLVEMAKSPHQNVREAAQENLGEFSFERYVEAYGMLDEEVRRSTGEMVKNVDPFTVPLLREEMTSPARAKRLRAIEMAVNLDLIDQVHEEMVALLEDEDLIVRLETIAALARTTSRESETLLRKSLNDPNERIREAAGRSLEERSLVGQWQEIWDSPNQ